MTSDEVTFALARKGEQNLCGFNAITTEHPKLLILEVGKNGGLLKQQKDSVTDLDLFAYVNSKFVYVERHVRTQMRQLYLDLLQHRCDLERESLKNSLAIALIAPDQFAYNFMKGPGYYAQIAGEAIYIIKCVAVEVQALKGKECFQQLRVLRRNGETWFLQPRTHILMRIGTQVSCNDIIPPLFSIDGTWYKFLPNAVETLPPRTIEPHKAETWHYKNPVALATAGIYGKEDLDTMRQSLLFPMEKPAILNVMARGTSGQPILYQGLSIHDMLDPNIIKTMAGHAVSWTWDKFLEFSNISSGVIGFLVICHTIKLVLGAIIRGYTLHSIFGWSLKLMAAVCSSITHLVIHLGTPQNPGQEEHNTLIPLEETPESETLSQQPSILKHIEPPKPRQHDHFSLRL